MRRWHQADGVAGLDRTFKDADIDDDALVAVVDAVEDEALRGASGSPVGRDVADHTLQHLIDVQASLGRDAGRVERAGR